MRPVGFCPVSVVLFRSDRTQKRSIVLRYDDSESGGYILLFDRSRSIVCRSNAWGF